MSRERILVYGPPGAGKTTAWLSIALHFPNSMFYVIDTDDSVSRMLESPKYKDLHNIEYQVVLTWDECKNATDEFMPKIKAGDWFVVDFSCSTWSMVTEYFIEEIFNKDIASYFLEARKSLKQGSKTLDALQGWVDWPVINKLYQHWVNNLMFRSPSHVFMTAKAAPLAEKENVAIKDMFSHVGLKPEGEKRMPYRAQTVILMVSKGNRYEATTIKERERSHFDNTEIVDFCLQYGLKAGWDVQPLG
jgi:hypothetical protein